MTFPGWSTENINRQLEVEQGIKDALIELVNAGISWEAAKTITNYGPAYGSINLRDLIQIRVSRTPTRYNSDRLEGNVLDAGKLYAVFIEDIPELEIDSITFDLDGIPVHTEASAPWDYDGTLPGGEASRVTFVVGSYTITAHITDAEGTFSIDASFSVEA